MPVPIVPVLALLAAQPASPCKATAISDHVQVTPGQTFTAVVTLLPDDGWHVYWSNPGDSGMASKVTWTLPAGVTVSAPHFPVPSAHTDEAGTTFVFERSLPLVYRVTVPEGYSGARLLLTARSEWLVCMTSCLPGSGTNVLDLSVGPEPVASAQEAEVQAALNLLPEEAKPGSVTVARRGKGVEIGWTTPFPRSLMEPVFLPAEEGLFDHKGQSWTSPGNQSQVGLVPFSPEATDPPKRVKGLLGWARPGSFELKPELTVNIDVPVP